MSESHNQRELQNQTATFNRLNQHRQPQPLSSIPQESAELAPLQNSMALPQSLIKSHANEAKQGDFSQSSRKKQEQSSRKEGMSGPNITFYPHLADRLLYEDTALQQLRAQQANLKGELSGLSEMISDLIDKKNGILNEYEQVVREKRAYKRLKKNLEQEYEGYLFMLDGDYCQKLDEETERLREVLVQLRHEVHALNNDLSRPLIKNQDKQTLKIQQLQKEFYEIQMGKEKLLISNKRKQERLTQILQKNTDKQAEIRQINKKIDKCEYERELQDDIDIDELKRNFEKHEQLSKKLGKLQKIKEKNQKFKESEYYRKIKEGREQEAANSALDKKIIQMNEKLYKSLVELQSMQQNPKASTVKEQLSSKIDPPAPKRTISAFKQPKYFPSEKNKLTLQPQALPRPLQHSSKSLARVQTQPVQTFDDRQQLLMRRKKIYTQLQRNMYFKNIENREEQKLSRIQQFDDKNNIAISSYDRFAQHSNQKQPLKLPQIQHRFPTDGNDSIIYSYESVPHQRKFNKRSIQLHNKQMRQLRVSKYHPNSSNYRQLCTLLNRDRLLIQQDCEYDMGQLIYNGNS